MQIAERVSRPADAHARAVGAVAGRAFGEIERASPRGVRQGSCGRQGDRILDRVSEAARIPCEHVEIGHEAAHLGSHIG